MLCVALGSGDNTKCVGGVALLLLPDDVMYCSHTECICDHTIVPSDGKKERRSTFSSLNPTSL